MNRLISEPIRSPLRLSYPTRVALTIPGAPLARSLALSLCFAVFLPARTFPENEAVCLLSSTSHSITLCVYPPSLVLSLFSSFHPFSLYAFPLSPSTPSPPPLAHSLSFPLILPPQFCRGVERERVRNPAHLQQQFQSVSSLRDWKYRRLACPL